MSVRTRNRRSCFSFATLSRTVLVAAIALVALPALSVSTAEDKSSDETQIAANSNEKTSPKKDAPKKKVRSLSERLKSATRSATTDTYLLQYKFKPGDKYFWNVEHSVKTETSIQGSTEVSHSHSDATKKWEVMDVSKDGVATLIYTLVDVNMRHKVTGEPEASYDSRSTEKAPENYKHVAEAIGLSLATIEINETGKVIRKQTNYRDVDLGVGDFTIELPEQPVRLGYQWNVKQNITARTEEGIARNLTARKVYKLKSVNLGVATISMRTEVLTPIHDPDIESQIVQKLTKGTIKFDIDDGRVLNRDFSWDEQVQGFRVPDSLMIYQASLTERKLDESEVGRRNDRQAANKVIKSPSDGPILRK